MNKTISSRYFSVFLSGLILFFLIVNISLNTVKFGDQFSFDYPHYLEFIAEVGDIETAVLIENAFQNFPYVRWADFGMFEIGFAVLVKITSLFLNPVAVYGFIASISLSIKWFVMVKLRVPLFLTVMLLVISSALLEANAIRAGMAVSVALLGCYYYYRKNNSSSLLCFIVAPFFHVSLSLFVLLIALAFFLDRFKWRIILYFLYSSLCFVFVFFLGDFLSLMGGKLGDYYKQAKDFGLYTQASGLNISTLIVAIPWFYFVVAFVFGRYPRIPFRADLSLFLLSGSLVLALGLLSGIFSIFFDRIFQIYIILASVYWGRITRSAHFSLSLRVVRVRSIHSIALNAAIFLYVLSLVFRYPQSNIFYYFSGIREYESLYLY